MRTPDWTQFRRLIYINSSVEELYHKWATQEGMQSWFLKYAPYRDGQGNDRAPNELCQAGDQYTWQWHNWDGEHKGNVVEANGRDKLILNFEHSVLEVSIYPGRGMVCVDLIQKNIPTDDMSKYNIYHGTSCGWTFWLANLKALMEHGITLNDTQPGLLDEHRDFDVVNI